MRKITKSIIWKNVALLLALSMVQHSSLAATEASKAKTPPADLQPLEDIPPPAITSDDNAEEPKVTIIKKKGETIEEYRINGQLYMMKITPAHGVPYYLHKEDQDGGWVNDGPVQPMSIPKWTIFRF